MLYATQAAHIALSTKHFTAENTHKIVEQDHIDV